MIPQVIDAKYNGDYKIWIRFSDGVQGVIDLKEELWGEIFEPLKDLKEFSKFIVSTDLNTLVWPNGADFAPEFLYKKLQPEYSLNNHPRTGVL